jgi:hypothetical protein
MLLKFMPGQIPEYWDEIKEGILMAVPHGVPDRTAKILNKLLLGTAQFWLSYNKKNNEPEVDAGIITVLVDDQVHDTRNLDIYAIWPIAKIPGSSWLEGFEALRKYAEKKGCNRVIGRSNIKSVVELVKRLGGQAEYTLIAFDV